MQNLSRYEQDKLADKLIDFPMQKCYLIVDFSNVITESSLPSLLR